MTNDSSSLVYEIHGEEDFAARVEAASTDHVVVVDFWAEWCAPCKMLGPTLERVVADFGGKAVLAKVNIEENEALAVKWGIRGIPAVKVFRNGAVIKDLVGALPENELRRELSECIPSDADEIVEEGRLLEQAGRTDEAAAFYRQAVAMQSDHPGATVGLARIAFRAGDTGEARQLAEAVAASEPEREEAEGILALMEFSERCAQDGGRTAIEARIAATPDDIDLAFGLACCLAAEQQYETALEQFLRVVEKDKHYKEDAAKKAMVSIFAIIGQRSALADDYRDRLMRILYS